MAAIDAEPRLSIVALAIRAAGLEDVFWRADLKVTLLLPADCAFMKMDAAARASLLQPPPDGATATLSLLQAVLLLHTIPGAWRSDVLTKYLATWPTLLEAWRQQTCRCSEAGASPPPPTFLTSYALPQPEPSQIPESCPSQALDAKSPAAMASALAGMQASGQRSQWQITQDGNVATVLRSDVEACGSVIHIVDTVFSPAGHARLGPAAPSARTPSTRSWQSEHPPPAADSTGASSGDGIASLGIGLPQIYAAAPPWPDRAPPGGRRLMQQQRQQPGPQAAGGGGHAPPQGHLLRVDESAQHAARQLSQLRGSSAAASASGAAVGGAAPTASSWVRSEGVGPAAPEAAQADTSPSRPEAGAARPAAGGGAANLDITLQSIAPSGSRCPSAGATTIRMVDDAACTPVTGLSAAALFLRAG